MAEKLNYVMTTTNLKEHVIHCRFKNVMNQSTIIKPEMVILHIKAWL